MAIERGFSRINTAATPFDFKPIRVLEVELSRPLPDITAVPAANGSAYEQAMILARLHGKPLGVVKLTLENGALSAANTAQFIWEAVGAEIRIHLAQDGLPDATDIDGLHAYHACPSQQRKETPFISVIIATRDRADYLKTALDSLLALAYPAYEIIVVDNAPQTAATAELIRGRYDNQVRYLREEHPGASPARNRGLTAARGEIVAFTDDDVIVDEGWLDGIVAGFDAADKVACVTGLTLPAELETPAQVWFEQYGGFSKGFDQRVFDMDENRPRDLRLFPYVVGRLGSGVNMAMKTAVLRKLGGFDVALGVGRPTLGGEDLALYFQVITSGYQLVYEPDALLYHIHRREYDRLQRQMVGYGVGLTAYLTQCLLAQPRRIFDLMRKLPYGLFYAFSIQSPKNKKKQSNYPKELTNLERKGMLYGPFAYLYSRWQVRHG